MAKPRRIKHEHIIAFDIDNTLLKWGKDHKKPGVGKIKVVCPYSNETVYLRGHSVHIRLLKQHSKRGYFIIAWSHAGSLWSKNAIKLLGLNKYVNLTMAKPSKHVDDKTHPIDIVGARIFLKDIE